MRRVVSTALIAVLAGALWSGVAAAAPGTDLTSTFAMRTFGRPAVEAPQFSAPDRSLRGLAFRSIMPVTLPPLARIAMPAVPTFALTLDSFRPAALTLGAFVPASPAPVATAAYSAANMQRFALTAPNLARVDDAPPAFSSSLRDASTAYSASTRVGAFALGGSTGDASVSELSARDQRLQAISSVVLGVAGNRVKFDLGSNYERLSTQSVPTFQYRPGNGLTKPSIVDVPGYSAAQIAGGYNDVTARGIDAGLAVPITRNLTLGMQYGTQRYTGAVNAQDFTANLDTRKFSYVGNLTFALPRSSSAIVVSARQYRFQDSITPANSTSQTRADVNFTVKF
jgi:hypothetical protein